MGIKIKIKTGFCPKMNKKILFEFFPVKNQKVLLQQYYGCKYRLQNYYLTNLDNFQSFAKRIIHFYFKIFLQAKSTYGVK